MNGFYWIYLTVFALFIAYTVSKEPERKMLVYYITCGVLILVPFFIWFRRKENNRLLTLPEAHMPKLYSGVMRVYDKRWFRSAVQIAMFAVLFLWYVTELDGAVYVMAPV